MGLQRRARNLAQGAFDTQVVFVHSIQGCEGTVWKDSTASEEIYVRRHGKWEEFRVSRRLVTPAKAAYGHGRAMGRVHDIYRQIGEFGAGAGIQDEHAEGAPGFAERRSRCLGRYGF